MGQTSGSVISINAARSVRRQAGAWSKGKPGNHLKPAFDWGALIMQLLNNP